MKTPLILSLTIALLLFLAAACGDSDNGDGDAEPTESTNGDVSGEPAGEPGPDSPIVSIADVEAIVGAEADAELIVAYELEPGVAAWTFDITYDADILSVADCDPVVETGVCNPTFDSDMVRLAGAHLGLDPGESVLGRITFQCDAAGESELEIAVETLADGTIGDPQPLIPNIEHGAITCS